MPAPPRDLPELFDLNLDVLDAPKLPKAKRDILVACLTVIRREIEEFVRDEQRSLLAAISYTLFEDAGLGRGGSRCPVCGD